MQRKRGYYTVSGTAFCVSDNNGGGEIRTRLVPRADWLVRMCLQAGCKVSCKLKPDRCPATRRYALAPAERTESLRLRESQNTAFTGQARVPGNKA